MPYKVKEYFRKSKTGRIIRVGQSTRKKKKLKKALTIGASVLTTLGLGALALKKLKGRNIGNVVKNLFKGKNTGNATKLLNPTKTIAKNADEVIVNKAKTIAKNADELVVNKSTSVKPRKYAIEPDPWVTPIVSKPPTVTKPIVSKPPTVVKSKVTKPPATTKPSTVTKSPKATTNSPTATKPSSVVKSNATTKSVVAKPSAAKSPTVVKSPTVRKPKATKSKVVKPSTTTKPSAITKKVELVATPKNKYKIEADPWLDNKVIKPNALVKSSKATKEIKLLAASKNKYKIEPDPWNTPTALKKSKVSKPPKATKEVKLLSAAKRKSPEYIPPTKPSKGFISENGTPKSLKEQIKSQSTLVKREATDIESSNTKLDLGNKYIKDNSKSAQTRGNSYITKANKRLSTISKRSPKRSKQGLITVKGKSRRSVRNGESSTLVLPKKLEKVVKKKIVDEPTKVVKAVVDKPPSASRRALLKKLTGVEMVRQAQTPNIMQSIKELGEGSEAIQKAGQDSFDSITKLLVTKGNRRQTIKAGAKGAERAVKGRIKRKLKGKLITRLTKSLKNKEFSPKNQSSAINQIKKVSNIVEGNPKVNRRKILQTVEDIVIPGGSEAKKKKAIAIYNNLLNEAKGLFEDTGVSAAKSYAKKKVKNKGARKTIGIAAKLKRTLTGEA